MSGASAWALLLALPGAAAAQAPDEQARRLLEDGRQYLARGQSKQALDNFNTILSGFAETESADDALLEIGRHQLEVEADPERARASFEQAAKRYPQSDGAPGAYYYLGWLTLSRAANAADLDDALAQFDRVRALYPGSDWVPRAFYASGLVHRRAGRFAEAVDLERRVALEYPASEAAPAAQFQIGHCLALLGEPRLAMEEYQRVRNRFPDSEWAGRALDRIAALYRLAGTPTPGFALDAGFSAGSGELLKDVRGLLMTPGRTLWIASDRTKSVLPVDRDGKLGQGVSAEEVRSLSLSPEGDVVVAARGAVRFGVRELKTFAVPDEKGIPEMLERISAAVVTTAQGILVADEKRKRVYRYDRRFEYLGPFPDARERDVRRMLLDGEGAVVMLDGDEKTVRVYDLTGRLLRSVGGKGASPELRRPADVAVDAALNLYVADEDAPAVLVFSPAGKLLATIRSEAMKKPRAVTLDPAGAVLVYDDRAQRVLRFR
jgi:TolA-binding protein